MDLPNPERHMDLSIPERHLGLPNSETPGSFRSWKSLGLPNPSVLLSPLAAPFLQSVILVMQDTILLHLPISAVLFGQLVFTIVLINYTCTCTHTNYHTHTYTLADTPTYTHTHTNKKLWPQILLLLHVLPIVFKDEEYYYLL